MKKSWDIILLSMTKPVPRLDLSSVTKEQSSNAPKSPLGSFAASIKAALTPRGANSSLLNRVERVDSVEDTPPTDAEYAQMANGFKRIKARPLVRDWEDRDANSDARRRHLSLMVPLEAFKDDLFVRWNLGVGPRNNDNQVVWSLAMKQIKVLAALSKQMIDQLTALENDLRDSQVLTSPRQIKQLDVSVQQIKITEFLVKQDRVIKEFSRQFFDIAKAYFETVETLDNRHAHSVLKKYFPPSDDLFTPRRPKTPRHSEGKDDG